MADPITPEARRGVRPERRRGACRARGEAVKAVNEYYETVQRWVDIGLTPRSSPIPSPIPWPIGSSCDVFFKLIMESMAQRDTHRQRYAYAVPNDGALETIAQHSPVIEIGAGTGYWAKLLDERGCDVVAYDERPTPDPENSHFEGLDERGRSIGPIPSYYPVHRGGPEKVLDHPNHALFLCWPPLGSPMAAWALALYAGDAVLHVGEWYGATADDCFHDLMEEFFEEKHCLAIPQWYGIHDELTVWKRK